MNQSDRERMLSLFQAAAATSPPTDGHVTDDDELLTAWRHGNLTPAEDARFVSHLETCPACRQAIATLAPLMLEASTEPTTVAVPVPNGNRSRSRRLMWSVVVAVAACVVIGVAWALTGSKEPAEMARARQDLEQGRPEDALVRLQAVRPDPVWGDKNRAELRRLWEKAAYEAAAADLKSGRYDEAARHCLSAREKGIESGRLVNVYLMATADPADRVPGEIAFEFRGHLLTRGYWPTGASGRLEPMVDSPTRTEAWRAAIRSHPNEPVLVLNSADHWLNWRPAGVRSSRQDEVVENLRKAATADPTGHMPHLAIGLVLFEAGETDKALQSFLEAEKLAPNHPAVLINIAVCLERLNRPAEARPYWEKALPLVTDPTIREQIALHLKN